MIPGGTPHDNVRQVDMVEKNIFLTFTLSVNKIIIYQFSVPRSRLQQTAPQKLFTGNWWFYLWRCIFRVCHYFIRARCTYLVWWILESAFVSWWVQWTWRRARFWYQFHQLKTEVKFKCYQNVFYFIYFLLSSTNSGNPRISGWDHKINEYILNLKKFPKNSKIKKKISMLSLINHRIYKAIKCEEWCHYKISIHATEYVNYFTRISQGHHAVIVLAAAVVCFVFFWGVGVSGNTRRANRLIKFTFLQSYRSTIFVWSSGCVFLFVVFDFVQFVCTFVVFMDLFVTSYPWN